jgi:hypothetical protein
MRKIYSLLLTVFFAATTNAQVNTYAFTQSTSTYSEISGTILGTATANTTAGSIDDQVFNIANGSFPFTFVFNGTGYTGCNVSTNGFITFGATAPSTTTYSPISSTTAYDGAITAFGGDINSFFSISGQTGDLSWGVIGSAPNREVVIQWRKYRPAFSTSTANVYSFGFQIHLQETSNIISVVYDGPGSYLIGSTAITGTRQVGLRGLTNADFNDRAATLSWALTTTGGANSSTVSFSTTSPNMPGSGLTYTWTPSTSACAGTPTAGSISGPASVCNGTTATLTLSGYSFPQSGISIQWQSSAVSGGPYTNISNATANVYTFTATSNLYYVAVVTCANGGGTATTTEFTLAIDPLPTVTVTPPSASICPGGSVSLTASGAITYTWSPASGLSATTGATVTANPSATTTYSVTGTGGNGCTATTPVTVTVNPPVILQVSSVSATICNGSSVTLTAQAGTTLNYSVSAVTYSPIPTPGSGVTTLANAGVAVTALTAGTLDDGRWENISLPFSFNFYGNNYSSINISTNGWIAMGATNTTSTGYNVILPAAGVPNNAIHAMTADLNESTVGTVEYFTTGSSPNRRFVVNYTNVGFFSGGGNATFQAILYEGTNVIEVHTTAVTNTATNKAQAVENATGTAAVIVSGRNNVATWTGMPDAYSFSPSGGTISYAWSPATSLNTTTGPTVIASPTSSITYTVVATDASTTCTNSVNIPVTVNQLPAITAQPTASTTVCAGATVIFTVGATGTGLTYQWRKGGSPLSNGGNISGATSASLIISPTVTGDAGNYDVVVSGTCSPSVTSNLAVLVVNTPPSITTQPVNQTPCIGNTATFTVAATGTGLTYQWRKGGSPLSNGGNISGVTSPTLTISNVAAGDVGSYDVVISGTCPPSVTSNAATLTVGVTAFITTQPSNASACPTISIVFSVVTSGAVTGHQWQLSTNSGTSFSNIAGATSSNLTVSGITTAMNNNQYRDSVSTTCQPIISSAATLTVYNPVTITTQPANITVCANVNVTFTVVATGSPTPLAYQWQVSTDAGVTFNNIAGTNSTTLTLTGVTTTQNNNRYRCIVTGYCGAVNSTAAILTANAVSAISISSLPSKICVDDTLINLSATPVGGVWSGVGILGNTFLPSRTAVGLYTLTYTYTNSSGCVSSSSVVVKVEDCPERMRLLENNGVILFPNPNNGRFNLKVNSNLYNYLSVRIFDIYGHLVNGVLVNKTYTPPTYNGLTYGRVIPFNLSYLPAGIYQVNVIYDDGARTTQKAFKVIIAH